MRTEAEEQAAQAVAITDIFDPCRALLRRAGLRRPLHLNGVTPMTDTDTTPETEIEAVKGFGMDWKCGDFQYEIGATYTHEGSVKACKEGFHAVENPLDVFSYYPPGISRYAVTKQSGAISRHHEDTKIASARITIEAELSLPDLIARGIAWIVAKTKSSDVSHSEGGCSAASSTGFQSAAMSSGLEGRAMGADGNALFLVYRDPETYYILHAWAGIVGRDGIKTGAWYQLSADGEPLEVTE